MEDYIYHHGIKGQKWGVRRFQNADGTLTDIGKKRKANVEVSKQQFKQQVIQRTSQKIVNKAAGVDKQNEELKEIAKTIAKGAAIAAATTLLSRTLTDLTDEGIAAGKVIMKRAIDEHWLEKAAHTNWVDKAINLQPIDWAIAKYYGFE